MARPSAIMSRIEPRLRPMKMMSSIQVSEPQRPTFSASDGA
jgi:hypothetical protein